MLEGVFGIRVEGDFDSTLDLRLHHAKLEVQVERTTLMSAQLKQVRRIKAPLQT